MKETLSYFDGPVTRENITAVIYRKLKQRLMMGALSPGEVLTLRSITEELKVSQTPVREALLQLASEGILTMEPGRSIKVPSLTLADLIELRQIRLVLERMATEAAVSRITDAEISQMVMIHRRLVTAKDAEQREETLQANFEFHFTLYSAAGMPQLLSIVESLWAKTGPSLRYLYQNPFVHLDGDHPHLSLIDALLRRDVTRAVAAIESDVVGHGHALMSRLEQVPEFGSSPAGTAAKESGSRKAARSIP